jgi:hypothetical protein
MGLMVAEPEVTACDPSATPPLVKVIVPEGVATPWVTEMVAMRATGAPAMAVAGSVETVTAVCAGLTVRAMGVETPGL